MPINGWYEGNHDNVTDANDVNGWADQSEHAFGNMIAGGFSYRFGEVISNYGTWGQLIYASPDNLSGADHGNPTGLDNYMPDNPGPDNSNWVQGHLVNAECGGGRDRAAYLTPITHNVNMWHAGYEAVLQRLVNRGEAYGASIQFNPHNLPDSRLIYRTHALPPPANSFVSVPNGLCVSLGIVIGGSMKTHHEVTGEFTSPGETKWFNNRYYGSAGRNDRDKILEMIGGTSINY